MAIVLIGSPRIGKETTGKFPWQLVCQSLGIGHYVVIKES